MKCKTCRKEQCECVPFKADLLPEIHAMLRTEALRRSVPLGRVLNDLIVAGIEPDGSYRSPEEIKERYRKLCEEA